MCKDRQCEDLVVQQMASGLGCVEKRQWRWPWQIRPDWEGLECQARKLRFKDCFGGRGPEVGDKITAEQVL